MSLDGPASVLLDLKVLDTRHHMALFASGLNRELDLAWDRRHEPEQGVAFEFLADWRDAVLTAARRELLIGAGVLP